MYEPICLIGAEEMRELHPRDHTLRWPGITAWANFNPVTDSRRLGYMPQTIQ
jgi:hypothetical protein